MPGRILQDVREYIEILRGHWRKDLKRLLERGQLVLPRPGEGSVIVPVERIHIPRLRFAAPPEDAELPNEEDGQGKDPSSGQDPGDRGVGQGKGQPGDILGKKGKGDGEGEGDGEGDEKSAGQGKGGNSINVEIPPEDLLALLREILELPWIQPKGSKRIKSEEWKFTDITRQGPRSLLHKRRTLKEAIKRTSSQQQGPLSLHKPATMIRDDMRYRIPIKVVKPKNSAVIYYMMDVSGSMGIEERRIVRYLCALCSFWLSWNYDGLEERWIIHDGEADLVSRDEFFGTYRGGGTVSSSAHVLMLKDIDINFPASEWNIYGVYLSDGFNWGTDNDICKGLIREKILPIANHYAYGEVSASRWGLPTTGGNPFTPPGDFGKMLVANFKPEDHVAWAVLKQMEHVPDAIKKFFEKGR